MRQLWLFLSNNHLFLLFLILEAAAFLLLVNQNDYHNSKVLHSYSGIAGGIIEKRSSLSEYFQLKESNQDLAAENARLRMQLGLVESDSLTDPVIPIDSTSYDRFSILPAKVISNVGPNHPYITINKGSKDGVQEESGVIATSGIVGKIVGVGKNYSLVMPILHKESRVNVQHGNSGFNGNMVWDGRSVDQVQIENIPRNARISVGDTISTNSYTKAFNDGMAAAVVEETNFDPTGNFYQIQARPVANFRKLNHVYVTILNDLEEIKVLENSMDE